MHYLEKHKTWILLALAVLTVAAFIALREVRTGPDASTTAPLENLLAPANKHQATNCGQCISQGGSAVDCDKLTQKYTCASKGTRCRTGSICR